ncbi:MAG: lipocalin family protein [Prevotella sp.]|nr:lipocalin family protein [Prevotella sp.]
MKKYFNLIMMAMLVALPLAFASCSSDDDDDENGSGQIIDVTPVTNVQASQLVGTWRCISSYFEEKYNGRVEKEENEDVESVVTIFSDGRFNTLDSDGEKEEGNWTLNKGILTLNFYDDEYWAPSYTITGFTGNRITVVGGMYEEGDYQIAKYTFERVK